MDITTNKNIVGKLELIMGPMFSGKSSELIKKIRLFRIINKNVLVIKPTIDTRYDKNRIVTHNNEKSDCVIIDDLSKIDSEIIKIYDIIIIDEGQFLLNLKINVINWVEELNKHVIISGLDCDFQRNPIGEMLDLIPYADQYKKYVALCKYCSDGTEAIFSKRITNSTEQFLIGDENEYVSVCRYHYLH